MTKQNIAKKLFDIDWVRAQCDCPSEWSRIIYLRDELMKLDQLEAIKLILEVMEAKECIQKHPDTMVSMKEFLYVNER